MKKQTIPVFCVTNQFITIISKNDSHVWFKCKISLHTSVNFHTFDVNSNITIINIWKVITCSDYALHNMFVGDVKHYVISDLLLCFDCYVCYVIRTGVCIV